MTTNDIGGFSQMAKELEAKNKESALMVAVRKLLENADYFDPENYDLSACQSVSVKLLHNLRKAYEALKSDD